MKTLLLIFSLGCAAYAGTAGITELNLPPWYNQSKQQIFHLELQNLPAGQIVLDHPCTVSVEEASLAVTNGRAMATLKIDLPSTPATFPLLVIGVAPDGQRTELRRLICHLSLVPNAVMVQIHGDHFSISNLTDRALEIEAFDNLEVSIQNDRQIHGKMFGRSWIRLKAQGLIELTPNLQKE